MIGSISKAEVKSKCGENDASDERVSDVQEKRVALREVSKCGAVERLSGIIPGDFDYDAIRIERLAK